MEKRGSTAEFPGFDDVEVVETGFDDMAQSHLRKHSNVDSEDWRETNSNEVTEGTKRKALILVPEPRRRVQLEWLISVSTDASLGSINQAEQY